MRTKLSIFRPQIPLESEVNPAPKGMAVKANPRSEIGGFGLMVRVGGGAGRGWGRRRSARASPTCGPNRPSSDLGFTLTVVQIRQFWSGKEPGLTQSASQNKLPWWDQMN